MHVRNRDYHRTQLARKKAYVRANFMGLQDKIADDPESAGRRVGLRARTPQPCRSDNPRRYRKGLDRFPIKEARLFQRDRIRFIDADAA